MNNVFTLFGKIAVDASDANSGIDGAVNKAQDAESKLTKTFKRIGTTIATVFTVSKIVDFGKTCAQTYASIAAEESAFEQIMGDYSETAQAKLDKVAENTGVAAARMTSHMTSLTAKFKGLGYDVEDATTLAADGLLLAADGAAFWDVSMDEAMSHLNSFINGSYEGGEAIGLFANDTQMAAYAVEKGIVADTKAWSALDEATKQATRLDYAKAMYEQSGATGQAAKESDEYANVLANLQSAWKQFQGVIGKPILEKIVLPAMRKLLDIMPGITEAVQGGIDWLTNGLDKVASYFTDVFTEEGLNLEALPDALGNMFGDLGRSIPNLLKSFGRTVKNVWTGSVWPVIQNVFSQFGIDLSGVNMDGIFASGKEALAGLVTAAGNLYTDITNAIARDESGKINLNLTLSNLFKAGVDAITGEDGLLTVAGNLISGIVEAITGDEDAAQTIRSFCTDLQTALNELLTWFEGKSAAINAMVIALGGIAMMSGKFVTGAALLATGTGMAYSDFMGEWYSYRTDGDTSEEATVLAGIIDALSEHDRGIASEVKDYRERWQEGRVSAPDQYRELNALLGYLKTERDNAKETGEAEYAETLETLIPQLEQMVNAAAEAAESWQGAPVPATQPEEEEEEEEEQETRTWVDDVKTFFETMFGLVSGVETVGGDENGYGLEHTREFVPAPSDYDGTGASLPALLAGIQALIESNNGLPDKITAAVADGFSGATVTAQVSQGNVILDGKVAGRVLAPYVNWTLGTTAGRDRG